MSSRFAFFKKIHLSVVLALGVLVFSVGAVALQAAPPGSPYVPADQILDPNCAPGDLNCYVDVTTGGGSATASNGLQILGGDVALGGILTQTNTFIDGDPANETGLYFGANSALSSFYVGVDNGTGGSGDIDFSATNNFGVTANSFLLQAPSGSSSLVAGANPAGIGLPGISLNATTGGFDASIFAGSIAGTTPVISVGNATAGGSTGTALRIVGYNMELLADDGTNATSAYLTPGTDTFAVNATTIQFADYPNFRDDTATLYSIGPTNNTNNSGSPNDVVFGGTFTGNATDTFSVTIDSANTFAWNDSQGNFASAVSIVAGMPTTLVNGVSVTFGSSTYIPGETWQMTIQSSAGNTPQNFLFTDASGKLMSAPVSFLGASPITIENSSSLFSTGLTDTGVGATGAQGSIFFGEGAGFTAVNAAGSNFLGFYAGYLAEEAANSNFFGEGAGYNAVYAAESNFFGKNTGFEATNASQSNFIGDGAGRSAEDAQAANFIGWSAGSGAVSAANSIFIGTNAGFNDLVNNTAAYDDVTTFADTSILIGHGTSTAGFSNSIALGAYAENTNSNQIVIGSRNRPITELVMVLNNIGDTCVIDTSGVNCPSDENAKTDITNIHDALSLVNQLEGVTYHWNEDSSVAQKTPGFIAQDVEKIIPEAVRYNESTGRYSMNYTQIIPYLVEAIKQLNTAVNAGVQTGADIAELTVNRLRAREICLEDVCITKTQLQQMLDATKRMSEMPAKEQVIISEEKPEPVIEQPVETSPEEPATETPVVENKTSDSTVQANELTDGKLSETNDELTQPKSASETIVDKKEATITPPTTQQSSGTTVTPKPAEL